MGTRLERISAAPALDATPRRASAAVRTPRGIARIVVCLDGSPFAELCIPDAVRVAHTFGSALILLTVLHPRHGIGARNGGDALDWEIARHEAEAYLQRIGGETAREAGLQVDTRVEQGHPAERIVAVSRELGADLTVIGSHGESGMTAWDLGGTARQVLSELRGSILLGRSSPRAETPSGARPRILVPLDGTPRTESVLPIVSRIARSRDAEVLLVHIVPEPRATAVLRSEADLALARELAARLEAGARCYLELLRGQLAHEGALARTLVIRHLDERESLVDVVARENVDLVVVSAHGATCNPASAFGSVAAHILSHSTVPVLVLQDIVDAKEDRSDRACEEQPAPPLRASFAPEHD